MDDAPGASARGPLEDPDRLTLTALEALLALPGVRRVGLALAEGGGRRLRFTATDQEPGERVDWCHIDAYDDVPLTTVVRTGDPIVAALDDLDARYAGMVDKQRQQGTVALAALPLMGGGAPIGGVVLFYDLPQAFGPAQTDALARGAARLSDTVRSLQAGGPRHASGLADSPVPPGVLVADTEVAGVPASVGQARRFLRAALAEWGADDDLVDSAVLCLSELVTNAVMHTGAPSEVRATLDEGVLTVTVRDRGTGRPAAVGNDEAPDPLRVHGRGLQVVDALSTRWGSLLDVAGTTVWFVLETAVA